MRRQTTPLLILAVAIVNITLAHYVTAIETGFLHNLYQRLYYLPHIVTDWQDRPMYRQEPDTRREVSRANAQHVDLSHAEFGLSRENV